MVAPVVTPSNEIMPPGQATMRLALKQAGVEPDKSWCSGEEKEFPDLALEIALTSGGINKLEIYRRFKVPEVWFRRRNKLENQSTGLLNQCDFFPS